MDPAVHFVDADRHTVEPLDLWQRALSPRWRPHAPVYAWPDRDRFRERAIQRLGAADGAALEPLPIVEVNGRPLLRDYSLEAQVEQAIAIRRRRNTWWSGNSPAAQLESMDRTGVAVAYLFPTWTSYLLAMDDEPPELSAEFARIYNDWLADYCAHSPSRLRPVGVIPRHTPEDAARELSRVLARGWKAVVLRPNPFRGRAPAHPDFREFWATCAAEAVAVVFHEGTHARVQTVGEGRFHSRFAQHACSHPMEQMLAFLALLETGTLERHPSLKIAFMEAGMGWVPFWLQRLDREFEQLHGEMEGRMTLRPSEYFRRQCWVAAEPEELRSPAAFQVSPTRILVGTDYPHVDHALDACSRLAVLEPDLRQLICSDNPTSFYEPGA